MFLKQPLDEFLGFQYERMDQNSIKVTLPIQPLFINTLGFVHGGIISTLADVAMCNIIEPDEQNQQKVVTLDLNITFLKGASGNYLVAHAMANKIGKTLTHTDCFIYDDDNQVVAKAKAIFFTRKKS